MNLNVRYTAPDAPAAFTRMIRETGFAVVTDHPIPHDLIDATYRDWQAFFASDAKFRYEYDRETYHGFYPYLSENAKDRDVKDLKEFFHVFPFSPLPEGMPANTFELRDRLTALATTLLDWVESQTPDDVRARFSMPLGAMIRDSQRTLFRILHYPPLDDGVDPRAVRSSAHEDINLLTLLPAGTAPGLQVRDATGVWVDVACDPATIVVNSGDMLQEASGGYYRSTTHRVVNPTGDARATSRYSMPLFLHARPEVRISDRYTAREYLDERLAEIGLREASPGVVTD